MELLDNQNLISQRDPQKALAVVSDAASQADWSVKLEQATGDNFMPDKIVLAGMGGSCLAGLIAKRWLDYQYDLRQPFEVVRDYRLPHYVDHSSLVICFSVSGNTEETLSCLDDAGIKGAHTVVVASGGKLLEIARQRNLPFVELAKISQPRYGVIMHLRAIAKILSHYGMTTSAYEEIAQLTQPLREFSGQLLPAVSTVDNQAKQLALNCVGKTPIVYASSLLGPIAYKWKISFNENAKNTAWWNQFPEFSHNEFIGWASHPIEKPFAIINLRSKLDNARINRRFELTEQLLSGRRPAAHDIWLGGDSLLEQMLKGLILADFTSIYLGILNGVNPTPVELVEELKRRLG
jgi:glucose/mannose-6-phosphate isomerase